MTTRLLRFALVCALYLTALAGTAGAEPLKLTASPWRPYVDANMHGSGFAMALVARALERAGYETITELGQWPAALEDTQAGNFDVFCTAWLTEERTATLAFSSPYVHNEITFVRRRDWGSGRNFKSREDLVGLRIGVVDDFAYSQQAYDTTGIDIAWAGSVKENMQRLQNRDVDLVLADRRVALLEINDQAMAKSFYVQPDPLITRGLRIAVSKQREDHEQIIAAFEAAIARMREDGSFAALLNTFRVSQ
jgi:polar amino acid transport system substrate-binding protein